MSTTCLLTQNTWTLNTIHNVNVSQNDDFVFVTLVSFLSFYANFLNQIFCASNFARKKIDWNFLLFVCKSKLNDKSWKFCFKLYLHLIAIAIAMKRIKLTLPLQQLNKFWNGNSVLLYFPWSSVFQLFFPWLLQMINLVHLSLLRLYHMKHATSTLPLVNC